MVRKIASLLQAPNTRLKRKGKSYTCTTLSYDLKRELEGKTE